MSLKVDTLEEGQKKIMRFAGQIDEDASFNALPPIPPQAVIMDLEKVTLINSCGIREWMKWIGSSSHTNIVYRNCPKVIVDQINMVEGFLPKNGRVESFFVPYYCESCEHVTQTKLLEGKGFSQGDIKAPDEIPCEKCQKPAEIDVIEGKYFKFLQR